ncbi:uncharacterized protein LOC143299566 isoform X2 [Babylonia areolata]|uniref:uncharacterized protein LOC143299566 isoform X2 n=1 Tax=Babylonia areolata TaxID=304850 RepID=UPI003FD328A6
MEKLDEDSAAKFINALIKSLQTLCHGYLNFDNGIEIVGHINLNVDKGSSMHYILEEKVCKNEENSTLFISNSFHAQNQNSKSKGKDSDTVGNRNEEKTSSADLGQAGKLSAISSISSALSKSHEKNRSGSTSSAKDSENLHSKPLSSTAKRKASDDYTNDVRAAKQAQLCSSPSPVSHFLSQSPHDPSGSSSPVDTKPSLRQLHGDESSGTVLPQTAAVSSDNAGDLGVNLVGSVLERVDDQSNSDLQDRGDDSDGDLEVTFIKEEYVEGEQSACQFENSGGQQYGRGTLQRASSSDMSDGSMYPVSLHHSQSASSTFVPSSHDLATAQHYGPSTSSQPQPGTSGIRGAYPPESHDSSACDQKILEATQLFKEWLGGKSLGEDTVRKMTVKQLDQLLSSFYREVRKKDGTPLKEHALRRVRSGLMKYLSKLLHLQCPISALDFQLSSKVYTEMLSKMPSRATMMLTRADCSIIRGHPSMSVDSPMSLLKKVWFELQLHFGARRWSPREMWPEVFVFVSDDDDAEYVMLDSEQLAESHLKPEIKDMLSRRRMLATGTSLCPVEALKLYLSKRERVAARPSEKVPFLQKPNPLWTSKNSLAWYTNSEISLGKNHNFIRELCEDMKLEACYTNMSLCFGDPKQYSDCWP